MGKEMKSKEEEYEDEETDGASNSSHVGVHWSSKGESLAVVSGKPGPRINLRFGIKIDQLWTKPAGESYVPLLGFEISFVSYACINKFLDIPCPPNEGKDYQGFAFNREI